MAIRPPAAVQRSIAKPPTRPTPPSPVPPIVQPAVAAPHLSEPPLPAVTTAAGEGVAVAAPTAPSVPSVSAPTGAVASAGQPGSATGRGFDLSGYLGRINHAVASRRNYPPAAIQLQLEGDALVRVHVHRDGSLASPPVVAQSCGHDILDREALRMVAQAAPFPPLPAGYSAATAELRIPVRFRLED